MDLLPLFFQSVSVAQISFQGSSSWYCNEAKCLSYFHNSTSDSTVYIGSLADGFVFKELVILNRLCLLYWALRLEPEQAHMLACVPAVWKTAGVHHAQVGVVTEVTV